MPLRIATKPSALAVIIGVVELLLSELFKFSSERASAWYRRTKLYRTGHFRIRANPYLQRPDVYFSTALLIVLLALTIVLELSIESATFPHSKRVPLSRNVLCFGPRRDTRYFNGHGPRTGELDDHRVATYVAQANCQSSLLDLSLQGAEALALGYPACLPPFERRRVHVVLALQGGAVGFVGNSDAGDPHLDYGLERDGHIVAPDAGEQLASTSFWNVVMHSQNKSTAFWKFSNATERVASSMGVPRSFLEQAPSAFDQQSVANVTCVSNSRQCYDSVRPAALSAVPVVFRYVENNLGLLSSSLKNLDSSLCIFDSRMEVEVSWIYLNLFIPEVERNGRNGPTIVRLSIKGDAQCLSQLPRQSARMYIDSMERIALNETLNSTQSATFDNMRLVLQKAAVITGLKTTSESGVPCQPRGVVNGSTVGVAELVVTVVFSTLLLLLAMFLLASSVAAYRTCPVRTDPLNALWPVQLLLEQTVDSAAVSQDTVELGEATESRDHGDGALLKTRSTAEDLWVSVSRDGGALRLTAHTTAHVDTQHARGTGNSDDAL